MSQSCVSTAVYKMTHRFISWALNTDHWEGVDDLSVGFWFGWSGICEFYTKQSQEFLQNVVENKKSPLYREERSEEMTGLGSLSSDSTNTLQPWWKEKLLRTRNILIFKDDAYESRRLHQIPLLSAKNRNLRQHWALTQSDWTPRLFPFSPFWWTGMLVKGIEILCFSCSIQTLQKALFLFPLSNTKRTADLRFTFLQGFLCKSLQKKEFSFQEGFITRSDAAWTKKQNKWNMHNKSDAYSCG